MLALLTRQRNMLKIVRFFNTFREHVAVFYISARLDLQPQRVRTFGLSLRIRSSFGPRTTKRGVGKSTGNWDEYARAQAIAKDKKWFRHPGIDIYGPDRPDHPFWTHMRRSYLYDPAPALRASRAPLLAIFGELDSPEGVKANVSAIN